MKTFKEYLHEVKLDLIHKIKRHNSNHKISVKNYEYHAQKSADFGSRKTKSGTEATYNSDKHIYHGLESERHLDLAHDEKDNEVAARKKLIDAARRKRKNMTEGAG